MTDSDIKEALQLLVEEQLKIEEDHLSTEDLVKYQSNELDSADVERVQIHLSLCTECADDFLSLEDFTDLANYSTGKEAVSPETAAGWLDLQQRMGTAVTVEPKPIQTESDSLRQRFLNFFDSRNLNFAFAALLLLMMLGAGILTARLYLQNQNLTARLEEQKNLPKEKEIIYQSIKIPDKQPIPVPQPTESPLEKPDQTEVNVKPTESTQTKQTEIKAKEREISELKEKIKDLSAPQVNVPIIDDVFHSTRSDDDSNVLEMSATTRIFTMIIPADTRDFAEDSPFELEVTNENGKSIIKAGGLRRDSQGNFTISLSRSNLPAGTFHFRLFGVSEGKRKIAADYNIVVKYK